MSAPPSKSKNKAPVGHHVIPARFLGQFAIPKSGQIRHRERVIWVYEKGKEPRESSIGSVCKENHYFSVRQPDGARNSQYESAVNLTIEAPFNDLLEVLESPLYFPRYEHAQLIYAYVANMFNRSKQRRTASDINSNEVRTATIKISKSDEQAKLLAAAYSIRWRRPISLSIVRETLGAEGSTERDLMHDENRFIEQIPVLDQQLVELLQGRPYGLLIAPQHSFFIVGDNPVLTRTPTPQGLQVGDGFSKPNVHVLMPISPRACLQIGLHGPFVRRPTVDEVTAINSDILSLAHARAFAYTRCDRIRDEMNRIGCSRKYRQHVFVMPPLNEDHLFGLMIRVALGIEDSSGVKQVEALRAWSNIYQ